MSMLQKYNNPLYLQERAILTPKNEMVHELNDRIMKMLPGEGLIIAQTMCAKQASIRMNQIYCTQPNS